MDPPYVVLSIIFLALVLYWHHVGNTHMVIINIGVFLANLYLALREPPYVRYIAQMST